MPRPQDFIHNRGLAQTLQELRRPAPEPETGWHEVGTDASPSEEDVNFNGSWQNLGGNYHSAGWYVSGDGEVRLKGTVRGGDVASAIFTLPEEARPQKTAVFAVPTLSGGTATIEVRTNGDVFVLEIRL